MPPEAANTPEPPRTDLKPAAENPWYVLATIYGEQSQDGRDEELHRRNRRIWNGWSCEHLPEDMRAELVQAVGLDVVELAPWTAQERAEVNRVFAAKGMDLPDPKAQVRLDCIAFAAPLNLSGFVFSTAATFNGSKFNSLVDFVGSAFCEVTEFEPKSFKASVNFKGAIFRKGLSFDQQPFVSSVSFESAIFVEDVVFYIVEFQAYASFSSATFKRRAHFPGSIFAGITTFDSCHFEQGASFEGCTFGDEPIKFSNLFSRGPVYFENTIWGKSEVSFFGSIFERQVSFASIGHTLEAIVTTFHGTSSFHGVKFLNGVSFQKVLFKGNAIFSWTTFDGRASFSNAIFEDWACFADCQFERPASFRKAQFKSRFPNLEGTVLHPHTIFTAKDACWPATALAPPAEESRESLAIIRHTVGKQGLPEQEHFFFRREMAFAARIGSPFRRFPYWAFGALSDYGNSLARPAFGLGLVAYFGLVFYWNWLAWYPPDDFDFAGPFWTAAGFTVAQLFGFLGFTGSFFGREFLDALPWPLKVVGGLQTIVGVILLFLLGLALRNRFRLK